MTAKKSTAEKTGKKAPVKDRAEEKHTGKAVKKAPVKKTGKKALTEKAHNEPVNTHLQTLKNAKTILLVDWPDKSVPLTLLKAGFMVIGYSPEKYTLVSYETSYAEDKLVFSDLEGPPGEVEIVNIFRPEEEHAEIIGRHVLPLKAKVIWLHPPVTSAKTAKLAKKHDLVFIKGSDISVVAAELLK